MLDGWRSKSSRPAVPPMRLEGPKLPIACANFVWQAILPAGGLSSPPGGLKGRLQPGLAATHRGFSRHENGSA